MLDAGSQVRPALAESWRLEDDGQRLVFELREGLTFSDGTPLDAEDVRRSWLRVIDPADPSPLSSLLDDVAGAAAYARGEGSADAVGIQRRRADAAPWTSSGRRRTSRRSPPCPRWRSCPRGIDELAAGPEAGSSFARIGRLRAARAGAGRDPTARPTSAYWAGTPHRSSASPSSPTTADAAPSTSSRTRPSTGPASRRPMPPGSAMTATLGPAAAAHRGDGRGLPGLRHQRAAPSTTRPSAAPWPWPWTGDGWPQLDGDDDPPPTSIVPPGIAARGDGDYLLPYDPDAARAELAAAGYPGGEGFPAVSLATYGVGPREAIAAELRARAGHRGDRRAAPVRGALALLDDRHARHVDPGVERRLSPRPRLPGPAAAQRQQRQHGPLERRRATTRSSTPRPPPATRRAGAALRGSPGHRARAGAAHPARLRQQLVAQPRRPARRTASPGSASCATRTSRGPTDEAPARLAAEPLAGHACWRAARSRSAACRAQPDVGFGEPQASGAFGETVVFSTTFALRPGAPPRRAADPAARATPSERVEHRGRRARAADRWRATVFQGGHIVPNTSWEYRFRVVTDEGQRHRPDGEPYASPTSASSGSVLAGDRVNVWWYEGGEGFARRALDDRRGGAWPRPQSCSASSEIEPVDFFIYSDTRGLPRRPWARPRARTSAARRIPASARSSGSSSHARSTPTGSTS